MLTSEEWEAYVDDLKQQLATESEVVVTQELLIGDLKKQLAQAKKVKGELLRVVKELKVGRKDLLKWLEEERNTTDIFQKALAPFTDAVDELQEELAQARKQRDDLDKAARSYVVETINSKSGVVLSEADENLRVALAAVKKAQDDADDLAWKNGTGRYSYRASRGQEQGKTTRNVSR